MQRTKEWWSVLNKGERVWLVYAARAEKDSGWGSPYLPEGYGDCGMCSTPTSFGGLCDHCSSHQNRIINKAERMIIRLKAVQLMADIEAMGIQPPNRRQAVKVVRRLMCRWNGERYTGVVNLDISITYHPLKPASELLVTGYSWYDLPYTK